MKKIVYLFGTGATIAEMQHQGIESHLSMSEIEMNIRELSATEGGKYEALYRKFSLTPSLDIEWVISLLDGCTLSETIRFKDVSSELKLLFRRYLIAQITERKIDPKISSCLLHLHKKYGNKMGDNGELLTGLFTLNYDDFLEEAINVVHGGINCGIGFKSKDYKCNLNAPPLFKLHGSLNWKINKHILQSQKLEISKDYQKILYQDDNSGWMPPSVYKRPQGAFENMWNRASILLENCDILRVIGSSLRSEDSALLSMIFTSQVKSEKPFKIELIVPTKDAIGSDENPIGITQRVNFLAGLTSFTDLDIIPKDFIDPGSTGNIYKQWIELKIDEIQQNLGVPLSEDIFLSKRLWEV